MILPICEICRETKKPYTFSVICNQCEHSGLMDMAKGCITEIAEVCCKDNNKQVFNALSKLSSRLSLGDFFDKEIKPKFFNVAA